MGSVSSFLIMGYFCFKAQTEIAQGYIDPSIKPTSIDGCDYTFNNSSFLLTTTTLSPTTISAPTSSNQLSFYYYALFGTVLTIFTANIASMAFGLQKSSEVKPVLIAPFMRKYFFKSSNNNVEMDVKRVAVTHSFNDDSPK